LCIRRHYVFVESLSYEDLEKYNFSWTEEDESSSS